jgi:hypothetical protein
VSARDPPPVPPKNRSATTASRSHIGGKTATVPSSLAKIYRRSVSQQNLVNKKLSELGDDEPDKEERSHSVDDGEKIGDLRSMLVDSGVSSLSSAYPLMVVCVVCDGHHLPSSSSCRLREESDNSCTLISASSRRCASSIAARLHTRFATSPT